MKEIQISEWSEFKEICINQKKLNIQCIDYKSKTGYHIFAVEGPIYWFINIITESDMRDFTKNYLKNANKRINNK